MAGADAEYAKRLDSDWWRGQTHPGVCSTSYPSAENGKQKGRGGGGKVDSEFPCRMQDAGCSWCLSLVPELNWFAAVAVSGRTKADMCSTVIQFRLFAGSDPRYTKCSLQPRHCLSFRFFVFPSIFSRKLSHAKSNDQFKPSPLRQNRSAATLRPLVLHTFQHSENTEHAQSLSPLSVWTSWVWHEVCVWR